MERRSKPRWRALLGVGAYAAVCVILASAAWVAVGTVATRGPAASPTTLALAATATDGSGPTGSPTPAPTDTPRVAPTFGPTPTAVATKGPFSMDIYKPGTFISQVSKWSCMAGATQNMMNIIGPKIDLTATRQVAISKMIIANTTGTDSLNGGYGPAGWAITLTQLGAGHYKLLIDNSLKQAMTDAVTALRATKRPVGLLAWKGAHSWVMTGFTSDHDPRYYPGSFTVLGANIVDVYYPRLSTIWGQTLGPDTFRDMTAMAKNYLPWKRPEGRYPGRDGKWLLVIPY